jgi:hypothetical protein
VSLTDEERAHLFRLMDRTRKERNEAELALGYLRYEALRKLSPREFVAINRRNLEGERFDDIVTAFVVGRYDQ